MRKLDTMTKQIHERRKNQVVRCDLWIIGTHTHTCTTPFYYECNVQINQQEWL